MKRCKICGSINSDDAPKCSFCHSDFETEGMSRQAEHVREKSPMEGTIVILLLLAISFLPTLPIALAVSAYMSPEITLLISWAVVFIVSLIVYRIATSNAHKMQHAQASYHMSDDIPESNYENDADEETEAVTESTESYMPVQLSNSTFSAALLEACQNVNAFTAPAYDADMSCETAAACLAGRFAKHAQGLDGAAARSLLAALAARRMVLLCGNDQAELDRAIASVALLTGEGTATVKMGRNCVTPTDLYVAQGTEQSPLPSDFLCRIYAAQMRQKSLCTFVLDAEAPKKLGSAMADLKPYLENGMIEGEITVKDANHSYGNFVMDETVPLPANTRLLFAYRPGSSTPVPRDMMDVCAFVNLKTGMIGGESLSGVLGALSFERLQRLCDEAEGRFALSEENWKKIDDLAEQLATACSFALDNKLITAMERFVGVYMAAGGSEQEALDAVLASILLPVALSVPSPAASGDAPALSQLLDVGFGLENLPACAEMLKKFSAA